VHHSHNNKRSVISKSSEVITILWLSGLLAKYWVNTLLLMIKSKPLCEAATRSVECSGWGSRVSGVSGFRFRFVGPVVSGFRFRNSSKLT
jgi:hypothetical protein